MSQNSLYEFCKSRKDICCYGAGVYGRVVLTWLEEHGIRVSGFVVSHNSLSNRKILEKKVCEISSDLLSDETSFVVAVSEQYRKEITDTLSLYGYSDYYVISEQEIWQLDQENLYSREYRVSNNINILLYHRVINIEPDTWKLAVTPEHFEEQIRFLKEHYSIIGFDDDWREVKEKSVIITFDDGYFDFYQYVVPILEKYHVPATVFVSTGNLDSEKEFWWDELERLLIVNPDCPTQIVFSGKEYRTGNMEEKSKTAYAIHPVLKAMEPDERELALSQLEQITRNRVLPRRNYRVMTSDELRKTASSDMVTVGGHTVTHNSLAFERTDQQTQEIVESKRIIEEITGRKINVFSYPFGGKEDYDYNTLRIVEEAGYEKAAAVRNGIEDNASCGYEICRNGIQDMPLVDFARNMRRLWTVYGDDN